ncbi:MAG: UMP kinase [Bacteroidota bacterium]
MHYKKILLKLSGEVLADQPQSSISKAQLQHYTQEITKVKNTGINMAIVLGGGNIYRGARTDEKVVARIPGDYMGMLATMINSIALYDMLVQKNIPARLMTQIGMPNIYEPYSRSKALSYLKKGYVVIIGGGLGKPCFTTDSAASLCAIELGVDVMLKGTNVDGIYTSDPKKDKGAKLYSALTIDQALKEKLHVMDFTALTLCQESNMPIIVYNSTKVDRLLGVLQNPKLGTLISP